MPVVIALLNSYSGLAAAATGFVLDNNVLIIAGSLVGASGIILTQIMCKAMNRSLANVLFGELGGGRDAASAPTTSTAARSSRTSAEEVAMLLDGAQRVVIVPGYGMAVAQAQHAVRDLANLLESRGIEVEFAIHPVAGRMPGHMNVLLAEADVPYEKLQGDGRHQPDDRRRPTWCIVIGANDVVNPVARTDPNSPIAGMPIIDVDKARTVVVVKRSLSPGFAGIPNPLFAADNTLMCFGDGKKALIELVRRSRKASGLARAVEPDLDALDGRQAFGDGGVDHRQEGLDPVGAVDDLDHHRLTGGQPQDLGRVQAAVRAESDHPAQRRGAGQTVAARRLDQPLVQRPTLVLVVLAHEDPQQPALALVRHEVTSRSSACSPARPAPAPRTR